MRTSVIYCIRNTVTDKVYVGSATNGLSSRKYLHRRLLKENRHHSLHLQRAWDKYGEVVFTWTVLEKVKVRDKTFLLSREQYWMDEFKSYEIEHGYNINPTAGSNAGAEFYKTESFLTKQRANGLKMADRMRVMASHPHSMERRIENSKDRCLLTEEQVIEVRRLLLTGMRQIDIGKLFNVSGGTISGIKRNSILAHGGTGGKDYQPRMKMSKITDEDRVRVKEMYGTLTQVQIAEKTGYSQSVISNIVRGN